MYVIYPAEEVVTLTYSFNSLPRPRQRPTLDVLDGLPPRALSPAPAQPRARSLPKTAPPELAERAPASPTPSLERPKTRERTKAKLLKKLGRAEDPEFGKIVRTPAPEEFELPAPLPTPAFSRKNIFDRDFDALFEVANTPQFGAHVRVTTPELDRPRSEPTPSPASPASASSECSGPPSARTSTPSTPTPKRSFLEGTTNCKPKKVSFFRKWSRVRESPPRATMQVPTPEMALRELTHPAHNDQLKNQQQVTFKLVKTVSDFTSQLSQLYERHSAELQVLVSNFRKRNGELRKERASCPSSLFHTWESLLQEVEADVVALGGAAGSLQRLVAAPLSERTYHLKLQARKLFVHREGCEMILAKADDQLNKSRQEYRATFMLYSNNPSPGALAAYYDSHNNYVQQLYATNAMLDQYHKHILPTILQELEEILTEVTAVVSEAIYQTGEIITEKSTSQVRRYEPLCAQARAVSSTADLAHLARALLAAQPPPRPARRPFLPPYPPEPDDPPMDVVQENMPPVLRGDMLLDRMGVTQARLNYEQLKKDAQDLEMEIKKLQDSLDSLARLQARSLEGNLFNKINEIQEEISMKKYDYRAAQLHLAAVRAQRELFAAKAESGGGAAERKLSSSSGGSMKNKWLKAFRSLKPPSAPPPHQAPSDKRNGAARDGARGGDSEAHNFQEYTYKKITPCDVCSQVLRGHTRQGLRCKLCKMNVHTDCVTQVGKCQTKSRLLRRQKSTSEIESRIQDAPFDEDSICRTLCMRHGNPRTSNSMVQYKARSSPSSPVHSRRLLSTRGGRMSSVELPDEHDKSLSSNSASPCPSPVKQLSKHQRLLPTNLYVILYNFKSRHADELDLKAGYKVTVIDTSDPDWWKGKCLGKIGYFPSKYCTKLQAGERPLQVTHNLQVSDGDNGLMLLRDQIVIQVGDEVDGMVMIRSGDNRQGVCPVKFLQEV